MITFKNLFVKNSRIILVSSSFVLLAFGLLSFNNTDFKIAQNLEIFFNVFREVNALYVDETDPEKLIESSINGMLESLDPYTTYISEEDVDEFKFMTTGKYGGVGALIRKAGHYTMVSEPYEGFPAQKSGLQAGDTILSIDGVSTFDKNIAEVSEMLKGSPNTSLSLQIKRLGVDSVITHTLVREQVSIPNIPYYGMLNHNTGYILLSNFMPNAGKEVKAASEDLMRQGAKSLILDLRSNPGGLLNEAVEVSNVWIERNQEIVSTRSRTGQGDKTYLTRQSPVDTSMPLVVLVNRSSASASEIVAGSLQDLDRAVVIGQRTFGKGLVQTTRPLNYNAHLKITTAKYYTPSGRCIQALDYAHRNEDGSVGYIPDSLISAFKTRNGRIVYDGGGIEPDIKIVEDAPGNITMALYAENHFFDFATIFASKNSSIERPAVFEVSNNLFDEFKLYLSDKQFTYSTESSEMLQELIKTARYEGYYDKIQGELTALEAQLIGDREKDLQTFQVEIKELLKDEIISRYYYQKGRIIASLNDDPEIQKAIDILNSKETLGTILNGSYKGETVFAYYTR
ncbi:MAG: S41 family peptidase [Bacteroidota bacterium]|nr:MAG: S41 family peptidase [Bacteroidota bacterium]